MYRMVMQQCRAPSIAANGRSSGRFDSFILSLNSLVREMAVGQNQGAPPILEPILVGIGMFTGGRIWILTHGQMLNGRWAYVGPRSKGRLGLGQLTVFSFAAKGQLWDGSKRTLGVDSEIILNHRSFQKPDLFPTWVVDGFLKRRIPGKNGEGNPSESC